MKKNSKQRLFEVMGRIDQHFGSVNEIDDESNVIERYAEKLNGEHLSQNSVEDAMDNANKYLEGYGVETITDENESVDNYWRDAIGLYINMGDTYEKTIVYDTKERQFLVTSWGDFVDKRENFFNTDSEMDEANLSDGTEDDTIGNSSHDGINAVDSAKINEIGAEMGSKAFKTDRPDSRTRKIRQDVLDNMFGKFMNKPELPLLVVDRSNGESQPTKFKFVKVEMRGVGNGDIFAFSFFSQDRNLALTFMYSPNDDEYLKNIEKYEFNPQMVNLLIYNAKLAKKLYEKIRGNVDTVDSALTKNDFKMFAKY